MAKEIKVNDRVYVEGRPDKDKPGHFAANGTVSGIIMDDDDEEPSEVIVMFSDDDVQNYFVDQLEWTDTLGGYWQVV